MILSNFFFAVKDAGTSDIESRLIFCKQLFIYIKSYESLNLQGMFSYTWYLKMWSFLIYFNYPIADRKPAL